MSEKVEQARTRRRWVSLAEFVAVAGLLMTGLTLYFNWSDRRAAEAGVRSAEAAKSRAGALVTLKGEVVDGGRRIAIADADRAITEATVRFPAKLGVATKDAMPGPEVQADWFEAPLLKLTDKGTDDRFGRLSVLVTTGWWDGETKRQDAAIYDILWRTEGRVLRGRRLVLTGWALKDRHASPDKLEIQD